MIRALKIAGKRHKVRWNARIKHHGEFDGERMEIAVAKGHADQQKETLLHEIMHGIEFHYDIDLDKEDPENHPNLTKMSQALFAVMRENKGLAQLIFGE